MFASLQLNSVAIPKSIWQKIRNLHIQALIMSCFRDWLQGTRITAVRSSGVKILLVIHYVQEIMWQVRNDVYVA